MVLADRNFWTISKKIKHFSQQKSKFHPEFQQKVFLFVNEKELRNPHSFFLLFHQCLIKLMKKKLSSQTEKFGDLVFSNFCHESLMVAISCSISGLKILRIRVVKTVECRLSWPCWSRSET